MRRPNQCGVDELAALIVGDDADAASLLDEPPRRGRKRLNLLYGTQYQVRPPRFRLFVNDRTLVTRDYAYYVENRLRERYALEGIPLVIDFVERQQRRRGE